MRINDNIIFFYCYLSRFSSIFFFFCSYINFLLNEKYSGFSLSLVSFMFRETVFWFSSDLREQLEKNISYKKTRQDKNKTKRDGDVVEVEGEVVKRKKK